MANLTKEQREAKAKEKQQNDYIAELEARLKAQEEDFQKKLESYGLTVTIRRTLGADINASCGQLRRSEANK